MPCIFFWLFEVPGTNLLCSHFNDRWLNIAVHMFHRCASIVHPPQVGRKSLTSSMAHVSEAKDFPTQRFSFSQLHGLREVDDLAPYLEILSPDQMRPPVQTRVTFDEETEVSRFVSFFLDILVWFVFVVFVSTLQNTFCFRFRQHNKNKVLLIDTVGDILVDNVQSSARKKQHQQRHVWPFGP